MGLYEKIKEVATSRGYSINRLEKELGFPRSSISKFESRILQFFKEPRVYGKCRYPRKYAVSSILVIL